MFTKVNNKSPFSVSKKQLKSGSAWNQVAKDRFIKQHGDVDHIPEGDNHSVPVQHFGPQIPHHSEEEMKIAVSSLEDQIKQLQQQDEEKKQMQAQKQAEQKPKDDFYDDWLNE